MADPKTYLEQRTKAAQMLMDQGYAKSATNAEFLASNAGRPGFQNSLSRFQSDYNKNPGKNGPLTDLTDMGKVAGALEQRAEQSRQAKAQAEESTVQRREMQGLLTVKGGYSGKVDGSDNEASKAAVTKFQKDYGLDPAKATNQETLIKLRQSVVQDPKTVGSLQTLAASGDQNKITAAQYGLASFGVPLNPSGQVTPVLTNGISRLAEVQAKEARREGTSPASGRTTTESDPRRVDRQPAAGAAVSVKPDETVKDVQAGLRAFGITQPEVEGQKKNMLVDGIVGPITRAGLIEYKTKYGLDGNAEIKDVVADMKTRIKTEPAVKARVEEVAAQGDGASRHDNRMLARIGNLDPSLAQPAKPATAAPAEPKPEEVAAIAPAARTDEQHAKDLGLSATAYEKLKVMEEQWQKDKRESPDGAVGDSPFIRAERIAASRQQGAAAPAAAEGSNAQPPAGDPLGDKIEKEGWTPGPDAQRVTPPVQPIVPRIPEQGRGSVQAPVAAAAPQYEGSPRGPGGDNGRLPQRADRNSDMRTQFRVSTGMEGVRETLALRGDLRAEGFAPQVAAKLASERRFSDLIAANPALDPRSVERAVEQETKLANQQEQWQQRGDRQMSAQADRSDRMADRSARQERSREEAEYNRSVKSIAGDYRKVSDIYGNGKPQDDYRARGIIGSRIVETVLGGSGGIPGVNLGGGGRGGNNPITMLLAAIGGGGAQQYASPVRRQGYDAGNPRGDDDDQWASNQTRGRFADAGTHGGMADPRTAIQSVEREIITADRNDPDLQSRRSPTGSSGPGVS